MDSKQVTALTFFQTIRRIDLSSYGYARHFKFLKESRVVVPDLGVAGKYAEVVSPFFTTIETHRTQNLVLTPLRDWLLPLLMNGQVRVA